jgi:hypothetical protein
MRGAPRTRDLAIGHTIGSTTPNSRGLEWAKKKLHIPVEAWNAGRVAPTGVDPVTSRFSVVRKSTFLACKRPILVCIVTEVAAQARASPQLRVHQWVHQRRTAIGGNR